MIIAIDFDGTCVTHAYPKVGKDIGEVSTLQQLVRNGHKLILYTMRSGNELQEAIDWFNDNQIPLWGIQTNPDQHKWTDSPKCYAQLYIDDAALGCPKRFDPTISERPFVVWSQVRRILLSMGLLVNTITEQNEKEYE